MTKHLALIVGAALSAHAGLYGQAGEVKTYSLGIGVDQRYSLTKSILETAPRFTLDYRITPTVRFSAGISRVITESKVGPNVPRQGTTTSLGVTWKFYQWGSWK